MSKKNEFAGNVGQVVMGDSNVSPSLSNVMHLSLGNEEEKLLTKLQRKDITKKVKELVAVSGLSALEIYRELLNKFGADKMDNFPRSKFNEACDHIDKRYTEYQNDDVSVEEVEMQVTTTIKEMPCETCLANSVQLKKTNFKVHVLFVLMALMVLTEIVFLLYAKPAKALSEKIVLERPADESCHMDGKNYSIGSAVRMPDGVIRQCVDAPGDAPSYWETTIKKPH